MGERRGKFPQVGRGQVDTEKGDSLGFASGTVESTQARVLSPAEALCPEDMEKGQGNSFHKTHRLCSHPVN